MKNAFKLYILIILFTTISFTSLGSTSNLYENQVTSSVCEGDTNIIKAGCSIAVGQVVRVTPGIVTGVTFDKMADCYNRFGPKESLVNPSSTTTSTGGTDTPIVDLNDPCNQLATLNPKMDKSKYAYIPHDPVLAISNSRPGIATLATIMEVTSKEATNGLILNRDYALAATFKNVPVLKTTFAASPTPIDRITGFVFNVWVLIRNIAYLILLVAALLLGITIMVGNQTVDKDGKIKLTVERAIPRVVIAVILISSSYWIGELILNSLVGGGIITGFASFIASSVFPAGEISDFGLFISYSVVILIMGVASGVVAVTGGGLLIPVLIAILAAIWKVFLVNFLLVKNIVQLLIFIMVSPISIVKGVLPSQNKSEAFKEYAAKLVTFVLNGFFLNLILFSSKAVLIYGSLNVLYTPVAGEETVFSAFAGEYSGLLSSVIIYLFSVIAFIYILGLANKSEDKAKAMAAELTGTKKEEKKDKES